MHFLKFKKQLRNFKANIYPCVFTKSSDNGNISTLQSEECILTIHHKKSKRTKYLTVVENDFDYICPHLEKKL